MDNGLLMDLDEVEILIARLRGLSGFIADTLDSIDTAVAKFGPGVWDSEAATAFRAAHALWAVHAREFAAGVQTAQEAMQTAHERVDRAIEANSIMFGGG